MKRHASQLATLALSLTLATLPLAACGNSGGSGADAGATDSAATEQEGSAAAAIDTSSWTTMRDALAVADGQDISYSYNDDYFVCVIRSGDAFIRTVSKMDKSKELDFADLDMGAEDYAEQLASVVGDFELQSAEDISGEMMGQDELDTYVGKTGKELVDAGFVFEYYSMYGGEQTGATMGKGNFSYEVTFDAKTTEDQTEDEGASIMDAPVTAIEGFGNLSSAALDPELVG